MSELREMNNKLKQSLDEAVRCSRPSPLLRLLPKRGLKSETTAESSAITELRDKLKQRDEQLDKAFQLLFETRKQLSEVQEQHTVSQLVTAATQKRKLQEEGVVYENLPSANVYETLRPVRAEEHVYAKLLPRAQKGCSFISDHTNYIHSKIVVV